MPTSKLRQQFKMEKALFYIIPSCDIHLSLASLVHHCEGFAFVYMDDERNAEDAIQVLDRIEFGRKGRRLRVEWSKEA